VVTTGAIRRAKLQSNHHRQQTNIQLLQASGLSCRPTNSVKALKEKLSHSMDLRGSSNLMVNLWEGCHACRQHKPKT